MKKKILIVMGSLAGGGAEKVLVDLLSNWDYSNFEIDLCLINGEGIYMSDIPKEVRVISLYKNSLIKKIEHRIYRHLRFPFFESQRIKRKLKSEYDSIISFLEGEPLKFHSYIVKKAKKNITWVHVDLFEYHNTVGYAFSAKHEIASYKKMDSVIFVSNDALKQFEKRFRKHRIVRYFNR